MTSASRHRPFGITLITAYDLLMVAILPTAIVMLRVFGMMGGERPETLHVFVTVMLAAGIVITASAVWRAENWARFVMVALITIYYVGLAVGAPYTVDVAAGAPDAWAAWLRVGRSVFWIALHGWYFFVAADWFFDPETLSSDDDRTWI